MFQFAVNHLQGTFLSSKNQCYCVLICNNLVLVSLSVSWLRLMKNMKSLK
jgi:hypothetical protein